MGKPSIFSREYKKKMKKRKRKRIIVVLFFIGILLAIGMSFYVKDTIKSVWHKNFNTVKEQVNKIINKNANDKKDSAVGKIENGITKPENAQNELEKVKNTQKEVEEKTYTLKLENGQEIAAVYEMKGNEGIFKHIAPIESGMLYDINPTGNAMVIFDEKAQTIWHIDINGKKSDITPAEYRGSDGTVYSKNDELKSKPEFVWCNSPKFIDDENVAYFSQLPWFNTENIKYVWTVNSKTQFHKYIQTISGNNLKFENITDKGLKIDADGNIKYLQSNGVVTE